jgi:hypothetical protein
MLRAHIRAWSRYAAPRGTRGPDCFGNQFWLFGAGVVLRAHIRAWSPMRLRGARQGLMVAGFVFVVGRGVSRGPRGGSVLAGLRICCGGL